MNEMAREPGSCSSEIENKQGYNQSNDFQVAWEPGICIYELKELIARVRCPKYNEIKLNEFMVPVGQGQAAQILSILEQNWIEKEARTEVGIWMIRW